MVCIGLAPGALSPPWQGIHAIEPPAAGPGALEDCGLGREASAHAVGDIGGTASPAPPPFTARRLQCVLSSSRVHESAGFIYAWSPHMPLSVKGLPEAASVAAALGLAFLPALDPYADPELVQRLVQAGTVSRADTSRVTANALLEQGLLHHFPSLLMFVHGELRGPSWPGYHRPAVLEYYLTARLR